MSEPSADLRTVAGSVLADLDDLVEVMGQTYRRDVPAYAALGEADMRDVVLVSRELVASFFRALLDGRAPGVDVDAMRRMGRRRLEMGVALEPVLHAYRLATRLVWDRVVAATPRGREHALAELGGRWMEHMDSCSSEVASGYLEASHDRLRHVDAHRSALLAAVLAAADAADAMAAAERFATNLAPRYAPLVLRDPGAASSLDRALADAPAGTIGGYRGALLALLVPVDETTRPGVAAQALVAALGDELTIVEGPSASPGAELGAAVAAAERLLGVARAMGRRGALAADALPEAQLLAGNARVARGLVADVLGPLRAADREGVLEATLRAYLRTGSVPETATAMFVHANTVTYRLRRVAQLTDRDPRTPVEATTLLLALLAADLATTSLEAEPL